jgi:hypothetical protein
MGQQLALYQDPSPALPAVPRREVGRKRLCASCQAQEARYGFRDAEHGDPALDRPRTLCFECFRVEIARRQAVAARLARGWNASQVSLPLDEKLRQLDLARRRAQIRARRVLGLG